jgi:hypothetical protein
MHKKDYREAIVTGRRKRKGSTVTRAPFSYAMKHSGDQ